MIKWRVQFLRFDTLVTMIAFADDEDTAINDAVRLAYIHNGWDLSDFESVAEPAYEMDQLL